MGQDKLKALLQESLAVATRTDAMKPSDLARWERLQSFIGIDEAAAVGPDMITQEAAITAKL